MQGVQKEQRRRPSWWGRGGRTALLAAGCLWLLAGCGSGNASSGGSGGSNTAAPAAGQTAVANAQNNAAPASAGGAQVAPDFAFYNGKTVTLVVATGPGGGYDTYGRLLAPYLQKYLPGSTVIVKNVPGAGHIIGANYIYEQKPDGLTLGTFNNGLIISQLTGEKGIKFDLNKFTWVGNAASDARVLILRKDSPYNTVDDLQKAKQPLKLAGAGVGSSSTNDEKLLADILGFPVQIVNGYTGQQADLAMQRGEIDGQVGS
ncbi:MAG: hypothetical protein K6T31_03435, partial [Alicyclobacillus sp.]|nr:hypothetical protein [Alicyclobacillus sp.]